ncbi:MAG: hypothetical protein LWX83_06200 [Anaerolineae bacterium]|nr:hypothetical protein [Anaerolineae bacterium]
MAGAARKLSGVYHAKELVYHYNKLPPYSQQEFYIGKKVAIIGVGNVMMDIARYVVTEVRAEEVTAIARRGPGEVKFDKGELDAVARNIDLQDLKAEIDRARPLVSPLSQDIDKPLALIEKVLPDAIWSGSTTHFTLRFLLSPVRILGDSAGRVCAIELEENRLEAEDGEIRAQPTGNCRTIEVDTVIFAIGDRVDDGLGLPAEGNLYARNPNPRYPMENNSYEILNPETGKPIDDIFVAGWSRRASTGLVGITRRDGINGARALMSYLDTLKNPAPFDFKKLKQRMAAIDQKVVTKNDLQRLRGVENEIAKQLGVPEYKFATVDEMLHAIDNRLTGIL